MQAMAEPFVANLLVEQPSVLPDILCHFPELVHCLRARATEDTRVDGVANDSFDQPGSNAANPRCDIVPGKPRDSILAKPRLTRQLWSQLHCSQLKLLLTGLYESMGSFRLKAVTNLFILTYWVEQRLVPVRRDQLDELVY